MNGLNLKGITGRDFTEKSLFIKWNERIWNI